MTTKTVSSGQTYSVSSGQTDMGDVVLGGGTLDVLSGGKIRNTTDDGTVNVTAGAMAIGTNVYGEQYVYSGGVAVGTLLYSTAFGAAGIQIDAGLTIGTTISGHGYELVSAGATASNTTICDSGTLTVYGTAIGTVISANPSGTTGGVAYVFGDTSRTRIENKGVEVIFAGASADATVISNGGVQAVLGIASGTIIRSGGVQYVSSGAMADGTVISKGGTEIVGAFGTDVGSGIGATTSDTVVRAGGIEEALSGGTTIGTEILSGGTEEVMSSGTANDTTIAGGTLELASGSIAGSVTFTKAGGDLQLDYSQGYEGMIAGFASPHRVTEEIDLRDIVYGSGTKLTFTEASNHLSGTLTVTDGTHTATLTLLGQYTAGQFHLASDGNGGTFITDPPLTGSGDGPALAPHNG